MKRVALALAVGVAALASPSLAQQGADWEACAVTAASGAPVVLPPWCTAFIEHEDRKARLRRLSALQGLAVRPQFHDYVMPRAELARVAGDFPADAPILRVVFPERVLFAVDSAELRPEAVEVLDVIAHSLRSEPPDVALFVAGHTDATASDAYNFNLSLRRADAVAQALKGRGVGLASIFRVGFGEGVPVASNADEGGRRLNRRVEFIFAARPEAAALWLARQATETCYAAADALAKCRKTVAIAEEVVEVAPPKVPRRKATSVIVPPRKTAVRPPRRYELDLGTRGVAIDVPRR